MAIHYNLTSSEAVRQKAQREIIWALDHAPFIRRHTMLMAEALS